MRRADAIRAALVLAPERTASGAIGGPVAGVDEAGRGPLAGPVVAAAVVLGRGAEVEPLAAELRDSKGLGPARRAELAARVRAVARVWAVRRVGAARIDRWGIERATQTAMARALSALGLDAAGAWVDGLRVPAWSGDAWPLVDGDRLSAAVMAAALLAKTARDREMVRWHARFPRFGFDRHKGYGTPAHLSALAAHGPCPIHRLTFLGPGDWGAPAAAGRRD